MNKPGYFRTKKGVIVRTLHRLDNKGLEFPWATLIKEDGREKITFYNDEGHHSSQLTHNNIIEYLGEERPCQMRKFEFEAYLHEYEMPHNPDSLHALEKAFGHKTSLLLSESPYPDATKWKVTLEEINK